MTSKIYHCGYCDQELNLIDIGKHFRQYHFNSKVEIKETSIN